jgi:IS5 family transposase
MMSQSPRGNDAAAAAAAEQLLAADRAYQGACQQFDLRVAQVREEMVGPARRSRLRAIQTLAGLTNAAEVSRVLHCPIEQVQRLLAEANTELGED